jgi:hypothetical protein
MQFFDTADRTQVDSPVATLKKATGWEKWLSIPEALLFSQKSRPALRPSSSPIQWAPNSEVKNEWSCKATALSTFMVFTKTFLPFITLSLEVQSAIKFIYVL